jgi:hypothetical protein
MAPEISTGNYGKQIDVYACGILLYEMLTGKVPFDGESAGEILMKHLTNTPDLSGLPFEFVPIVAKALAKNPSARFATMAEMVQAVEALNAPLPAALPVARAAPIPAARAAVRPVAELPSVLPAPPLSKRGFVGELAGSLAMAAVLAALSTVLWGAMLHGPNGQLLGTLFFVTTGIAWAVLVPSKFWTLSRGDGWGRRLVLLGFGSLVGLGVLWLDGWTPHWPPQPGDLGLVRSDGRGLTGQFGYVAYFALTLAAMRWWRLADRRRKYWFSLFPVLASGFWALVLSFVWPWPQPLYGAAALVTASMIVQWVSPWEPPAPAAPKRLRLRYA